MSEPMAFPSGAHAVWAPNPGMTLRDYFAAAALSAVYAALDRASELTEMVDPEFAAQSAYDVADAMLAERAKEAK